MEREVRQAEDARRNAILHNDAAALDRLIADSFLSTLDDGRLITKAGEVAANRTSDRKVESWNETDIKIRLYGNTAIVTGLATVKDRFRDEGPREFAFRFTHVWAKLDNRWQLVGRHISGRSVPRSRPGDGV
jgi:ketosteroid isomerase-like protein